MKSSEVLRWCYRHNCDLEFKSDPAGVVCLVTTKRKGTIVCNKILLRDHDAVADDLCRFVEKLSRDLNLE